MRELNKLLGIKTAVSTAYHPQTDSQTEHINQEIEQYLRLFVNQHQDNWYKWVSLTEFTYTNEARSALQRAAEDMVHFYDIHYQHAPTYKVGDKVWLNAQNITTTQSTKKLDHKWLGPYTVDKVISQNAYQL